MGARLSTRRGSHQDHGEVLSIFELLLQLFKVGSTDDAAEEFDRLLRQLFDTAIDDVPYEAIEVYFKNFVLHNLLTANLKHGQICRYWDRYAELLEHIVERETGASNRSSWSSSVFRSLRSSYGDSIDKSTLDMRSAKSTSRGNTLKSTQSYPSDGSHYSHCDSSSCTTYTDITVESEETSSSSVGAESVAAPTQGDDYMSHRYESIRRGKGDVKRALTFFIVSKIFVKCLVESVNAVELLFHMDYLPYYLEWVSMTQFKLIGHTEATLVDPKGQEGQTGSHEDGGELQEADRANKNAGEPNVDGVVSDKKASGLADDNESDEAEASSIPVSEAMVAPVVESQKQHEAEITENRRVIRLRVVEQKETISVRVPVDVTFESLKEDILSVASRAWPYGTMQALQRGFCFIDHQMRIFSLKSIVGLFEHTNETVELMAIPFCTSSYEGTGETSRLKRLLLALHSYITAHIKPASSAHGAFLRASQSMAADVLVMLLSSIVTTPYLCAHADQSQPPPPPPTFAKITNVPKSVRAVAPFYYIHMECVRFQLMIGAPPNKDPTELQPVFDYLMKTNAPMMYTLVEPLRSAIGARGFEAAAQCLVRLLSASTSSGQKRHLVNLRNHLPLLLLLLIGARERDLLLPGKGPSGYNRKAVENGAEAPSRMQSCKLAKALKSMGLQVPASMLNSHIAASCVPHSMWFAEHVPPELMSTMAKALARTSASKICANELWLVLIDVLAHDKNFASTFFAKPGSFVRELMGAIRKHSELPKEGTNGRTKSTAPNDIADYLVSKSPLVRTMVSILVHYLVQKKVGVYPLGESIDVQESYADESHVDMDHLVCTVISVLAWNFQTLKDEHLVSALYLLVNQLITTPVVLSRSTSEKLLENLCGWLSAAIAAINGVPQTSTCLTRAHIDVLILIEMVSAVLNVIKAALSPTTVDKNLSLIQTLLNRCAVEQTDDLIFDIKDSAFDATCELLGLEQVRSHTIALLDFLSLLLRTFMGYKINAMYEFDPAKPGFKSHSVMLAVSDVVREINEEDNRTKSALPLAIVSNVDTVNPPCADARDVMHYHMSQIWIAAYSSQLHSTLWHYDSEKK
ncbi:multidrug efflux RND transporter permease subunit [Babesia caballi]|uniref:Multidrug efflux RND transporter permease subunit n=1 Tax=Babesia caballi TaxID=5871 RepID=A0AAV4LYF2_BABCB|nr:multidrug efflux RND transporter permease subunit [Babesia caballi]